MKRATQTVLFVLLLAAMFLAGTWYTQGGAVTAAAPGARTILYYVDPMHPSYTSDKPGIAPDCGMELVPVYADETPRGGSAPAAPSGTVSVSAATQQLLGVQVAPVTKEATTQTLRVVGRVVPDEGRLYRVNAGVEGTIREVADVTTGSHVTKNQVLASFFSVDIRTPIQGYLTALDVLDRVARTGERPEQVRSGDANSQFSVERLRNVGMSDVQIEELKRTRDVSLLTKIVAPADGYVLARNVSLGQKFDKGAEWYRIADLSQVWIEADVFKTEVQHFRPGLVARATLADDPGTEFKARVSLVPTQSDGTTRTLKVRLEADNPGAVLRPDMFVDVTLPINLPPSISVPVDALIDSGLKQTVFVEKGEGVFEPRSVETGWRHGGRVEIVKGLEPGERIAVSGTFLLDSESRMRMPAAGATGPGHEGHMHPAAPEAPSAAGPHAGHSHSMPMTASAK